MIARARTARANAAPAFAGAPGCGVPAAARKLCGVASPVRPVARSPAATAHVLTPMPVRSAFAAALSLSLSACCAVCPRGESDALLLATLYVNVSAEYDAACEGVYASATDALARTMAGRPATARPAAVVLDVDETVLDNSAYEVRLVQDGTSYPDGWDAWCDGAQAGPVPGAKAFIDAARALGVEVFFVTNRKAHLEAGTRKNLEREGMLVDRPFDVVLMRGEQEDWTRDKESRRAHVARTHDIVMMAGDNLGDFLSVAGEAPTHAERQALVTASAGLWGTRWFMLPNPMYGGWDEAAVDHDYGAGARAVRQRRLGKMDAMRSPR